jgi:membrane protein implicated in regulation of membrane protease activity
VNTPSTDVSPGFWGFVVFAILAVALYFLMRNMNSRMRRMSYRQKDAHREGTEPQATDEDRPQE